MGITTTLVMQLHLGCMNGIVINLFCLVLEEIHQRVKQGALILGETLVMTLRPTYLFHIYVTKS